MKKDSKVVLVTIVILLLLSLSATIIGFISNRKGNYYNKNPRRELYYNNAIWFFDDDKLISNYECTNKDCIIASSTITDDTYGINYFKDGSELSTPIINNKFVFISDNELVRLFDIKEGKVLKDYKLINTYNTKLDDDMYILKNTDDAWGILSINNNIREVLPFEYSFIGIKNNINKKGNFEAKEFIVCKDSEWYILDTNDTVLFGGIVNQIIDYNDKYVFSKEDGNIKIYSREKVELFTDKVIKNYLLSDVYIALETDGKVDIYTISGNTFVKSVEDLSISNGMEMIVDGNKIIFEKDDKVIETIELS